MIFNDNDRRAIWLTAVTNVDPATATLTFAIDGTEYPCTWDATATHDTTVTSGYPNGKWTRTARTAAFAGPAVPLGEIAGAPVLTLGVHETEQRITIGSTIIAIRAESIRVK